jgi:hypothetical protein
MKKLKILLDLSVPDCVTNDVAKSIVKNAVIYGLEDLQADPDVYDGLPEGYADEIDFSGKVAVL